MQIGSEKWIDLVRKGASNLGIDVSREQADQFAQHGQLLLEWNRKINLTRITGPTEVAIKHFIDTIAPMHHIPDHGALLDIGTGGGFPGIPLKIMRPGQPMTVIDSVRKKINFVKHVIRQLSLENITAVHCRAEVLSDQKKPPPPYRAILCRALTDLESAVRLARPLLEPGGKILLYQVPGNDPLAFGRSPEVLIVDGLSYRRSTYDYALPFSGDERRVTLLIPISD